MNEGHRILLIEDNRPDADIIRELIKDTGIVHELIWLDNGEKAIKFFDDGEQANLIIIDLNLPRVSGHEVLEFLKARGISKTTPVIVLTGSDSTLDKEKARKNNVVCYLIKPMTAEEMEGTTETLREIMLGQRSCNC